MPCHGRGIAMSSEITNPAGRVRTFSSRGASPALLFDDGTATPVRRSIDTKARTGRTVAWLSERLGAVPPEVARDWAEAASVFVAPEPVAYGDRESALAAVTANVAGRLSELTYTYQLGTV